MNMDTIVRLSQSSGDILYVMALLLLVAFTITIERSWHLKRIVDSISRSIHKFSRIDKIETSALYEMRNQSIDLPHTHLLDVVLEHDFSHDFDRLPDKLDEAIMMEAPSIDRYLWVLDTIVTLAPLLGLLGTIIGIFNAFQVLSSPGTAPTAITGGVAEALISTASGLFIAIIGLLALNGLNNRTRVIMHQLQTLKLMLINRIYPHYHFPERLGSNERLRSAGPRAIRAEEA